MVKALTCIPDKQHVYAVLVAHLSTKFQPITERIILKSFNELQLSLNECSLTHSKNILLFLS
jgi:hypothetical protein